MKILKLPKKGMKPVRPKKRTKLPENPYYVTEADLQLWNWAPKNRG